MYRPRISPKQLKELYHIARSLDISVARVLAMALEDFLQRHRNLASAGQPLSSAEKRPRKANRA